MTKKQMTYKSFIVPMVGRHYNVRAVVSKNTGRVLHIYAGCRHWRSFDEALAHYAGHGSCYTPRWINLRDVVTLGDAERLGREGDYSNRHYSLIALSRAAGLVRKYQALCKKRASRKKRRL